MWHHILQFQHAVIQKDVMWIEYFWQNIRSKKTVKLIPMFKLILKKTTATLGLPISRILGEMAPGPLPLLYLQGHCLDSALEHWPLFWGQEFPFCRRKGEGGAVFLASTEYGWVGDFIHSHVPYWRLPCVWVFKRLIGQNQQLCNEYKDHWHFENQIHGPNGSSTDKQSCWVLTGEARTAAKLRYLYLYVHDIMYHIIHTSFLYHILHHIDWNWYRIVYSIFQCDIVDMI